MVLILALLVVDRRCNLLGLLVGHHSRRLVLRYDEVQDPHDPDVQGDLCIETETEVPMTTSATAFILVLYGGAHHLGASTSYTGDDLWSYERDDFFYVATLDYMIG